MKNTIRAGRIAGDPTVGLCERICIEVPRVYDGCRDTFDNQTVLFELTDISAQATPPFTFVSAHSYGTAVWENITVTPLDNGRARVAGDVVIPVSVTFTDALGNPYTGKSELRLHKDTVLCVPRRAVVPYEFRVTALFAGQTGNFIGERTVSVTGCYTYVLKVIVPVDILVPTYGYAVYPECTDCGGNACTALLSLPLFP